MARSKRKPLSFSTTMRNPDRITSFLHALLPFEGRNLTNEVIMNIVHRVIKSRLYRPVYVGKVSRIKLIFDNEDADMSDALVHEIIENSPQKHKEAGFEYGWESRFDTWYKLPKEFGFLYYEKDAPLRISSVGHMLIDAYSEEDDIDFVKIQNVFLNSMIKYQSDNPFRKNLNSNVPLLLLLQVIKMLKNKFGEDNPGIARKELPLFICYPDNNAEELFNLILQIRERVGYNFSDEYIYEICLGLLEATDSDRNYYKMDKITGEAVDEYIRKMRSTGVISLRGSGRFLDFNNIEIDKINYILENYAEYEAYEDLEEYYQYMGKIDKNVINIERTITVDLSDVRKRTLHDFANRYSYDDIQKELRHLTSKRSSSSDPVLKYIPEPTRLEFLTSIALVQNYDGIDVRPNYVVDDEGLPTFTAPGGKADIEVYSPETDSIFEVTMMTDKNGQVAHEIIPIRRHLLEQLEENRIETFAVLIAPRIHPDAVQMATYYKVVENLDLITLSVDEFITKISTTGRVLDLLSV